MTDPFAAGPAQPTAQAGTTIPCSKCQAPIDPNLAGWSDSGERICKRCEAVQTIDTGDMRAAQSIVGGGIAAFAIGLTSVCFNPLLLLSALAFAAGVGTLVMLKRHPEYKERMGWRHPATVAGAVFGILFSMIIPFILAIGALSAIAMR